MSISFYAPQHFGYRKIQKPLTEGTLKGAKKRRLDARMKFNYPYNKSYQLPEYGRSHHVPIIQKVIITSADNKPITIKKILSIFV
jgi:hypothetical protein